MTTKVNRIYNLSEFVTLFRRHEDGTLCEYEDIRCYDHWPEYPFHKSRSKIEWAKCLKTIRKEWLNPPGYFCEVSCIVVLRIYRIDSYLKVFGNGSVAIETQTTLIRAWERRRSKREHDCFNKRWYNVTVRERKKLGGQDDH